METGKLRRQILLLFLIVCSRVYAQDAEKSESFVTRTGEGLIVSQSISFPRIPNAVKYSVEIERLQAHEYHPLQILETEVNRIVLSLRAGDYRYRITAHNAMNLAEGRSDWQLLSIRPAVEPLVESYQPFYGLLYDLTDVFGTITITGDFFYEDSEFALVKSDRFDWSNADLKNMAGVIFPDEVVVDENRAYLTFDRAKIKTGNYSIFIRNPGGLWSVFGRVRAGYMKSGGLSFAYGYSPMIAAFDYGNTERTGWTDYYPGYTGSDSYTYRELDAFNLQGSYFRLGWTFLKGKTGNFGLEDQFHFIVHRGIEMNRDQNGDAGYRFFAPFSSMMINLFYQKPLTERRNHFFRLGFGISSPYDSKITQEYSLLIPWTLNAGYYGQYFLWKNLFLEAGLDIQYVFIVNHFVIRPGIGFGWQTDRWAEYAEVAESVRRGEDISVPVSAAPKSEHLAAFGWYPLIPLPGLEQYAYDEDGSRGAQFLTPFNSGGFFLQYAYLPVSWGRNKFGFETDLSLLMHINQVKLNNEADNISDIGFFVLYQRLFADNYRLNIKGGVGLGNSYIYRLRDGDYYSEGPAFSYKTGASVQYLFQHGVYVEAGLDFSFIQTTVVRPYMRPGLSIGRQFNRNSEPGLRLNGTGFPALKQEEK
jgi:hypothetical protein